MDVDCIIQIKHIEYRENIRFQINTAQNNDLRSLNKAKTNTKSEINRINALPTPVTNMFIYLIIL